LIRPGPRADPRAFLNGESREAENFTQRQRSATQPGTGPNRTAAERGRGKKEDSWNVLKEEGWGFGDALDRDQVEMCPQKWGFGTKIQSELTQDAGHR